MADTGSTDLARVAARLKAAGDGELRKELLRAIRTAAQQAIPDIKDSAATTLPRRGGLAEQIAAQAYGVRTSLAASGATIKIVGQGMKELTEIDKGTVRHPTFAHRRSLFSSNVTGAGLMVGRRSGEWHSQAVTPGFFSGSIMKRAPEIRGEIQKAMNDIARRVAR